MSAYAWLLDLGLLPRTISEGLALVGTREVAGNGNSPTIMAWADEVGVKALGYKYTGDNVPWCGLFAALVAKRAGKTVPTGPLYALNWSVFGQPVAKRDGLVDSKPLLFQPGMKASLGDVLVFKRPGGGHVGFYIGEDATTYCVLGGNQSDAVGFTWIEKSRCVAVRRPAYTQPPASVRPYQLARSGAISKDEA
jgi:hypothetical protein